MILDRGERALGAVRQRRREPGLVHEGRPRTILMHAERERRVRAHAGYDVRRICMIFKGALHALAPL